MLKLINQTLEHYDNDDVEFEVNKIDLKRRKRTFRFTIEELQE